MNLALLAVLGVLSVLVAAGGMGPVAAAVGDLARVRPLSVSPLLAPRWRVASLFLLYLPATRMVHFFSKYFTYHEVRWDDRPRETGQQARPASSRGPGLRRSTGRRRTRAPGRRGPRWPRRCRKTESTGE